MAGELTGEMAEEIVSFVISEFRIWFVPVLIRFEWVIIGFGSALISLGFRFIKFSVEFYREFRRVHLVSITVT
jgi:hypothetical protein